MSILTHDALAPQQSYGPTPSMHLPKRLFYSDLIHSSLLLDMNRHAHYGQLFVALLALLGSVAAHSLLGCSPTQPIPREATVALPREALPSDITRDVSLEQLENDPTFLSELGPEQRATQLSRLWFEHGSRLEPSSYTGALAALVRSAHTASEGLLSENCRTPFYAPCRDLDQSYKRALDAAMRLLAKHGWTAPDLGRTRYQLTPDSTRALGSLRDWQISLAQPALEHIPTRPGLGLSAVGCRHLRGSDRICSPLTFVMTFAGPVAAEHSLVNLQALDTYQQEVLTVGSQTIPLAAAFEQTAQTLGTLAAHSPSAALSCLSIPTASASTALIIVEASDALATAQNVLVPLLRDPAITATTTFCLQTVGENGTTAPTPRGIIESLRAAHTVLPVAPLATTTRQPLSVIAIGDRATSLAVAFANRASRSRPAHERRPNRELRFMPQGIIALHSVEAPHPGAHTTDIPLQTFTAPCDLQCLRGVKEMLTSATHLSTTALGDDTTPTSTVDDERLSPIM